MTCKPGDLVFIPFPYSDLSSLKKRPVLVLTVPDRHGDFIALAVTSVAQAGQALKLTNESLVQGALPKNSWIRLDKVFTLSVQSIIKTLGRISEESLQQVLKGLCDSVGFSKIS